MKNEKTIFGIILTSLLASVLISAVNIQLVKSQSTTVEIVFENGLNEIDKGIGSNFTVTIKVFNTPDISQYIVELSWDPDVLELQTGAEADVHKGTFLEGDAFLVTIGLPGHIDEVTEGRMSGTRAGTGDLFTVDFRAIARGDSPIAFERHVLLNGLNYVDSVAINGTVHAAGHDVAVTDVTLSKTIVNQGYSTDINVSVENQGTSNETFDLIVYADATSIGPQSVTLEIGASTTITFTWNTTGAAFGSHTIRAEASVVAGEMDTADNKLIDGTILIEPNFHDIAVIDVRISNNFVYAGEDDVDIFVDVWNPGYFQETFDVTANADKNLTMLGDEIIVGTRSLSLPKKGSTTLTFKWDTFGVSPGNYTISAVASNVPQEDDSTNNLYANGKVEVFGEVPCHDINITYPTTLTVNPSIFTYDATYRARLMNIGNVTIKSTGHQGYLRVVGSRNGTIHLNVNQPDVDVYMFYLPLYGEVQIPLWLMFQPETHWETYNGNFTLELTICGTWRMKIEIVGISITVCENGAYIVRDQTVTFTWNLTGGSWVYLEAEANLPPGWSYSIDPPTGTLFETPHIITVNITAPPDAKEGDMGTVTLRAYKNSTGTLIWQFIYFASTDNKPPTIETIETPILTFNGDLLFNSTVKDASGVQGVQLYYSVNDGPWNNQTMQWDSGDTFNSTSYTSMLPHLPDNSTVKYYIVATDWLGNQTQSDTETITVKYDLAITEVKISKITVAQGFSTQINVTIANQGTIPSTSLKIAVYTNTTLLGIQTIPALANNTVTTLTFYWNTSNVPKGKYQITAFAIPILDEVDTSDNTLTGGWITVTKIGDLGGGLPPQFLSFDDKVDGIDLALFVQAYKKLAPSEAMFLADLGSMTPLGPKFFQVDDKVDGTDLALWIQCYKGLGPYP